MRAVRVAMAVVLAAALFGAAFYSDEAKEFKPKNGRFTVMFPAAKKSGDRQQVVDLTGGGAPAPTTGRRTMRRPGQRGTKMPIEMHYAIRTDDTKFTAGSAGVPAALIRDIPLDKRFEMFSDAFTKALDGKITDETQIKQGEIPGKRYEIEKKDGAARMDLYLYVGWVLYATVEGKSKDDLKTKEATAFFDSFKLTQPEKKGDDKKADDKKGDDKNGADKQ
jgi:hypothetical protein